MSSPTPAWAKGFSFMASPQPVMHEVGGQELPFLPVSVSTIMKLRGLVQPISDALAVLFDSKEGDSSLTQRTVDGNSEYINEGTPKEVIELRLAAKRDAMAKLSEAVSSEENMKAVGEVVLNSLRGHEWPNGQQPTPGDFVKTIPIDAMAAMLMGVMKANKGVFGPLGGRLGSIEKLVEAKVSEMGLNSTAQESGQQQENQQTKETAGQS